MNPASATRRAAALLVSLVTTLAIFSGVAGLAAADHVEPTLAKGAVVAPGA
jgi:hypothetical protein